MTIKPALWAAAIWIVILIIGSLSPVKAKRTLHTLNTNAGSVRSSWNHIAVHLVGFGVMAFLLALNASKSRQRVLALIGTTLLGIAIEAAQTRLGNAPFEISDVNYDVIAAILGTTAAFLLKGRF